MATYIGALKKNGEVRLVEYLDDGAVDELGITLIEFFQAAGDVRNLVKSTVYSVYEDEVEYDEDITYEEYDGISDLMDNVDLDDHIYYIFNGVWNVIGDDEWDEMTDLEEVIEEM